MARESFWFLFDSNNMSIYREDMHKNDF